MAKPIISKFSVIDAAQKNTVRYTCYDDTVNEVEYVIHDNASGNIIIDKTVNTSGASSIRTFTLPAGLVHNRLLVFYGSEANYYNGNFSGVIIKWDQSTDMFDFDGSVDYRETFIDWLTNKKPKVLKMYDGRAWLINANGNVSYSDDEHPDKVEISFDFIETGDLNSSSDMKNAGLI